MIAAGFPWSSTARHTVPNAPCPHRATRDHLPRRVPDGMGAVIASSAYQTATIRWYAGGVREDGLSEIDTLLVENRRLRFRLELMEVAASATSLTELLAGALSVLVESPSLAAGPRAGVFMLGLMGGRDPLPTRVVGDLDPAALGRVRQGVDAVLAGAAPGGSEFVFVPIRSGPTSLGVVFVESHAGGADADLFEEFGRRLADAILHVRTVHQSGRVATVLAEAAEAVAANRAKTSFLENTGHELRTPLNAILGYTEMLIEDAAERGWQDAVPDLVRVRSAGTRLLSLIGAILAMASAEAGRMDLVITSFSLDDLLAREVARVRSRLVEGITLEVDVPPSLGQIRADRDKLRDVVAHLFDNAVKFTESGTIRLVVRREGSPGYQDISIKISDTGVGIPADAIDGLFEPFKMVDPSTSRRHGGAGLGLALSRIYVRLMGGEISLSSVLGRGVTVSVTLPVTASSAPSKAAVPAQGGDLVLVVDDDPVARNLLERALVRKGYRVAMAANGIEAIQRARELHPIAVTLDVVMPDMDGWSVLSQMKSAPDLSRIPVILVTMTDDRARGYALGASDVMSKPYDLDRLLDILDRQKGFVAQPTALIVDDDAPTRHMLRRTLTRDGWTCMEAENGAEALLRVAETVPDVILLDLLMPEMGGLDFLARLRAVPAWLSIPVVIVTATDLSDADSARLRGELAAHVLRKGGTAQDQLLQDVVRMVRTTSAGSRRS